MFIISEKEIKAMKWGKKGDRGGKEKTERNTAHSPNLRSTSYKFCELSEQKNNLIM